jgi:hypothetical protein
MIIVRIDCTNAGRESGAKSRQLLQLAEELYPYRVARSKRWSQSAIGED